MNLASIIDSASRRRGRPHQPGPGDDLRHLARAGGRPPRRAGRPGAASRATAWPSSPATTGTSWSPTWPAWAPVWSSCRSTRRRPPPSCEFELATTGARAVVVTPAAAAGLRRPRPRRAARPRVRDRDRRGRPARRRRARRPARPSEPTPVVERERRRPGRAHVHQRHRRGAAGRHAQPRQPPGQPRAGPVGRPAGQQGPDDVVFGLLPLFHIFGLNVVLDLSLLAGSRVLLIERFDPSSAVEAIERHEVTMMSGPPTMWSALAALPRRLALVVAVGAPAPCRARPSCPAEVVDGGAGQPRPRPDRGLRPDRDRRRSSPRPPAPTPRSARSGRCCPASRCAWSTPTARMRWSATPARSGCGAPTCSRATGTIPRPPPPPSPRDGWLRTGDIGVVDDDGYVFLVDRAKDLIIVSGFNVFPAEVEEVLIEHPAIDRAAVVGVPHPHTGEAVKAYVVLEPPGCRPKRTTSSTSAPTGWPATSARRR